MTTGQHGPIDGDAAITRFDQSLHRFMRYFMVHINPILHRTEYQGRTYSEYEIVVAMALGIAGPLRPIDLSRTFAIEKGTLTALIRRLRERDLVEKRAIPGDERSYLVVLTKAGKAFTDHLQRQRYRRLQELFAGMETGELDRAAEGMDLLSAYLQQMEQEHARKAENATTGA